MEAVLMCHIYICRSVSGIILKLTRFVCGKGVCERNRGVNDEAPELGQEAERMEEPFPELVIPPGNLRQEEFNLGHVMFEMPFNIQIDMVSRP